MSAYPIFHNKVLDADKLNNEYLPKALATLAPSEHEVLENLADWGKHRVVFLITHRLSTIRNADQIAFLEDGRIVEMGSHDELMKLGDGRYRRFVNAEVEGVVTAEGSES